MSRRFRSQLKISRKLGWRNVYAALRHRVLSRVGVYQRALPSTQLELSGSVWRPGKEFVEAPAEFLRSGVAGVIQHADEICRGVFRQFEQNPVSQGRLPDWHKGDYWAFAKEHFSRVPMDIPDIDIKVCWDLSRFKWSVQLSVAAIVSPSSSQRQIYLDRLNELTAHWIRQNGLHQGVNWSCGQETSLRGLNLILSTELLSQVGVTPSTEMIEFIHQSFRRVRLTIRYSLSQSNNHSLTEAIFLLYASLFLAKYSGLKPDLKQHETRVEELFALLILPDGSTSMYSINYHRVFCDIVALCRTIDRFLPSKIWSNDAILARVHGMVRFLSAIIDPSSNRAPMIGHNDGTLHCHQDLPFDNFAPSLLWISSAFDLAVPARFRDIESHVYLFGQPVAFSDGATPSGLQRFDDFGLIIVDRDRYRAYLKYPRNDFRPAHMDFGHLDLWSEGNNLLLDSGTFSYNSAKGREAEFSGMSSHNSPAPLDAEFVSRFSKFLLEYWPSASVEVSGDVVVCNICNGKQINIERRIIFSEEEIVVRDRVAGSEQWAVRFHAAASAEMHSLVLSPLAYLEFSTGAEVSYEVAQRAPNYLAKEYCRRIVVKPAVHMRELSTRIIFKKAPNDSCLARG